ncbi:NAD-dependent epimerase/dehydratase family protein [Erythrobacteraceae bacterium WH01K]|nr:NAD-dependent epimerase/dehydratase family protein [Erythrobacteraceae bacterium WH01K]
MIAPTIILGGDGFCGWPTALHLSAAGRPVVIVDNLSRRAIDAQLGVQSLTPIANIEERVAAWKEVSGNSIEFENIDIAGSPVELTQLLDRLRPEAIVHFAEQRAAPYSMRGPEEKRYTVDNNVNATHNLLVALVELGLDAHLVHLGTMGVYGYSGAGFTLPEGYLDVEIRDDEGNSQPREILYPTKPGSVYHMTKSIDQLLFQFYAQNDELRITDLHQGIVWGTQTEETRRDPRLINRFDYDGEYGTVLNRFLVQAAVGHPLTVHGTGGQTRAFINIQDTVRSVALALSDPPARGERTRIINQATETLRVRELAELVARITGAEITNVTNPRAEADENDLKVSNASLLRMGLDPITLSEGLAQETLEISRRFSDRIDLVHIPARSAWSAERAEAIRDDREQISAMLEVEG